MLQKTAFLLVWHLSSGAEICQEAQTVTVAYSVVYLSKLWLHGASNLQVNWLLIATASNSNDVTYFSDIPYYFALK